MKQKMSKLVDFTSFFQKVKSQPLSFKTSYRLTLLNQEIQKHIEFYQESFRELIIKYSKKDGEGQPVQTEDGQGILLIPETQDEAYEKLAELHDLDVELPDTKFSIEEFEKIELSPEEMMIIMPFIEA